MENVSSLLSRPQCRGQLQIPAQAKVGQGVYKFLFFLTTAINFNPGVLSVAHLFQGGMVRVVVLLGSNQEQFLVCNC